MTIRAPFKHQIPVSSANQPVKPVLPVDQDNIFSADSDIAAAAAADTQVYQSQEVDIPTAAVMIQHAKALASVSTKVVSDAVDSVVYPDMTAAEVQVQIDKIFSETIGHPGYGSAVARVSGFVVPERRSYARVECLVSADNKSTTSCTASITTFAPNTQLTAACEATISNLLFSCVSYRWGQDTVSGSWANPNSNAPFAFVRGTKYILAIRMRIPGGTSVVDTDWTYQFAHESAPDVWTEINYATDISRTDTPSAYDWTIPPAGIYPIITPDNFVTLPGPGVPNLADGMKVVADEMSPIISSTSDITETEVQICLIPQLGIPTGNYYLRVVSSIERAIVRPLYQHLSTPWIIGVT